MRSYVSCWSWKGEGIQSPFDPDFPKPDWIIKAARSQGGMDAERGRYRPLPLRSYKAAPPQHTRICLPEWISSVGGRCFLFPCCLRFSMRLLCNLGRFLWKDLSRKPFCLPWILIRWMLRHTEVSPAVKERPVQAPAGLSRRWPLPFRQ